MAEISDFQFRGNTTAPRPASLWSFAHSSGDVWGNVSTWLEQTKQLTGKPIPAGGNVEYTFTSDAPGRAPTVNIKCAVTLNPTPDFVVAAYKATGTEYQDYVNSQK